MKIYKSRHISVFLLFIMIFSLIPFENVQSIEERLLISKDRLVTKPMNNKISNNNSMMNMNNSKSKLSNKDEIQENKNIENTGQVTEAKSITPRVDISDKPLVSRPLDKEGNLNIDNLTPKLSIESEDLYRKEGHEESEIVVEEKSIDEKVDDKKADTGKLEDKKQATGSDKQASEIINEVKDIKKEEVKLTENEPTKPSLNEKSKNKVGVANNKLIAKSSSIGEWRPAVLEFSTVYGKIPKLPSKVGMTKNPSGVRYERVEWDSFATMESTYETPEESITINGTLIDYYGTPITATVKINPNVDFVKEDLRLSTPKGVVPNLPSSIGVTLTNGKTTTASVKWENSARVVSTYNIDQQYVEIKGNLTGYDQREVTATVDILTVTSIADINLSTAYGVVPSLPSQVSVTLSDGKERNAPIKWNKDVKSVNTYITPLDSVTLNGNLVGYGDLDIAANVEVVNVSSLEDMSISTPKGVVPTLPTHIEGVLTNGKKEKIAVTWEPKAKSASTYNYEPYVTITGNLSKYDKREVTLNVSTLSVKEISKINLKAIYGKVPTIPSTVSVVLSDGSIKSAPVKWRDGANKNITYTTYEDEIEIKGDLVGYGNKEVVAKVNIVNISEIRKLNISTPKGKVPSLPSEIRVTLNTGETTDVGITWDKYATIQDTYNRDSVVTITGTLKDYDKREIRLDIEILTVASISELKYKTPYGEVPFLPSNIKVIMSNGVEMVAPIRWNDSAKEVSTYSQKKPTVDIEGNLIGFGEVGVSATVEVLTISSVMEVESRTIHGEIPYLLNQVRVTLSDGTTKDIPIVWEGKARSIETYTTYDDEVEIKGKCATYGGIEVLRKVKVLNIKEVGDINLSTPKGKVPTLPSDIKVILNTGVDSRLKINWDPEASIASTYVEGEEVIINGKIQNYDKRQIKAVVKILKVSSINDMNIKTPYGVVPNLPTSVRAKLNNGTEANVQIKWDDNAKNIAIYMPKGNTARIKGNVVGYGDEEVLFNVEILRISSVDEINYTTNYGVVPKLSSATVTLSDGTRVSSLPVLWDQDCTLVEAYKTEKSYIPINGRIASYGGKDVTGKVTIINVSSVKPIQISTPYGVIAKLPDKVTVTLNNGQTTSVEVIWKPNAGLVETYKKENPTIEVKGNLANFDEREVSAEVTLFKVISISEMKYTTPYGVVPNIQDYTNVTLSNGTVVRAAISWDEGVKKVSTYETKEPFIKIKGSLIGFNEEKVEAIVTVQTISKVVESNITTFYGVIPELPTKVKIILSDGTKVSDIPVIWEPKAKNIETFTTKDTCVSVKGKISKYDGKEFEENIVVANIDTINDINVSTPKGVVPKLPNYIDVGLTNTQYHRCEMDWDKEALIEATYITDKPNIEISGNIKGFDKRKITIKVMILSVSKVNDCNISTEYGVVPKLPAYVPVTLSDGSLTQAPVKWYDSAKEAATYAKQQSNVTIKGQLIGFGNGEIEVKVNIQTVDSVIDGDIITTYAVVPSLPTDIYVMMSDGDKVRVPVKWEEDATSPAKYITKELSVTIKGSIVGYGNKEVSKRVVVLNVNTILPISIITPRGVVPKLPGSIPVILNNGVNVNAPITWDPSSIEPKLYDDEKEAVSIRGTLNGYDKSEVIATVTIISVDSINCGDISTPYGEVPNLPNTVKVKLNNGKSEEVQITWDDSAKDKEIYKNPNGKVTIVGHLVSYGKKEVKANVTILTVKAAKELQITTKYGVSPSLPSSIYTELSDGSQRNVPVTWNPAALDPTTYITKDLFIKVKGKYVGYGDKEIEAKVMVLNVNPLESIVVSTPKGIVPKLPYSIYTMINDGTKRWVDIDWNDEAKNQQTYNEDKQTVTVSGNIKDYDKREITAIVNVLTVSLINYKNISTPYGVVANLPNSMNVLLNDGSSLDVPVKWDDYASKVETYTTFDPVVTIKGRLLSYGQKEVELKVNVQTVKEYDEINLITKYGNVPELPTKISCILSDGTHNFVYVKWNEDAKKSDVYKSNTTINGTVVGYGDKSITAKVSIINISSINPINISTSKGVVPNLPDKVNVNTSDGKNVWVGIHWHKEANQVDTYNVNKPTVTIKGDLLDYDKRTIEVPVSVLAVSDINYGNITTPYGVVPNLPSVLNIVLNNGKSVSASVKWDEDATKSSTYTTKEPVVIARGKIVGYGNEVVEIKVTVQTVALVEPINIRTKYGVIPELTNADVILSDGTKKTLPVKWEEEAFSVSKYRTDKQNVRVNGNIIGYENNAIIANVTVVNVKNIDDINISTPKAVVPTLPSFVNAMLNNGETTKLEINWDELAKTKETYLKDEETVTINGKIVDYDERKITATVKILDVYSVADIKVTTEYGKAPVLPQNVSVTLNDGAKSILQVVWGKDDLLPEKYETKDKQVIVKGNIFGYRDKVVTAYVTVIPKVFGPIKDFKISAEYGLKPNLPEKIDVMLSNGEKKSTPVIWEQTANLDSTYTTPEKTVNINGTLPEFNNEKITVTINVLPNITSIDDIKISTVKGVVPKLPEVITIVLRDGTKCNTKIVWDETAKLIETYIAQTKVEIKGILPEYGDKPVIIPVEVKPCVDSFEEINLSVDYGVVPKLPEEVSVVLSDGTTAKAKITWNDVAKLKDTYSTNESIVTIEGILEEYGNKKIIVKVTIKSVDKELTEQKHYGEEGVNSATGNLSRNYTDMTLNSSNTNMNVARTYNGKDTRKDSALGKGWTFGFEGWIKNYKDKDLMKVIKLPNGSIETFNTNSDGTFSANDSRNTLIKTVDGIYVLKAKDQNTFGFNNNGYLIWMKDRYGNSTDIDVDSKGKVLSVKDAGGRHLTVAYNAQGLIEKVTDGTGRNVRYNYTNNLLTSVVDPTSKTINYKYNKGGVLIEVSDSNDNLVEAIVYYEEEGENKSKVSSITDKFGNTQKYTYDNENKATTITDSNDRVRIDYTDSSMYTIKSMDPENKATTTVYNVDSDGNNNFGEAQSITDRNGNITKYERDKNGNIITQTNADNSIKTFLYDRKNNKIKEVDENGKKTFYIYDESGIYLLKKVQPLNGTDEYSDTANKDKFAITSYIYYLGSEASSLGCKVKGLLKQVIDPNGNSNIYTYDENGNVKTSTDGEGNKTTYEYDKNGWKIGVISPNGNKTKYVYDNDGNLMLTVLNDEETIRVVRDIERRTVKEISPNVYDSSFDNTKFDKYSDDVGTRYVYNNNGTVQSVKDANNNVTKYTYDIYGNIITEIKPDGAVYSYDYDVMNRVIHEYYQENAFSQKIKLSDYIYTILEDGKTQKEQIKYLNSNETAVTTSIYDYANRLVEQNNADSTKLITKYDANGAVLSVTDANGNTTYYRYDGLNRQTEKWVPFEKKDGKILYSYSKVEYDNGGRKIVEAVGEDKVYLDDASNNLIAVNYSYYDNNKLKSQISSSGKRTDFSYDKDGSISKTIDYVDSNNQHITEYKNNHLGKPITKIVHVRKGDIDGNDYLDNSDLAIETNYSYDKNGNVKTITTADGVTTVYGYDNLNRQNSVSQPGTDENGQSVTLNTSSKFNYEGKVVATTDGNGNTTTYCYDGRGNLVRKIDAKGNVTAFYYDIANRKIADVAPNAYSNNKDLSQMDRTEYEYDVMGRIITVKSICFDKDLNGIKSVVTKAYAYDKNGNVIKELDALGYQSGAGSNATEIINSGYGTDMTYNLANKLITVQDADGKERAIPYNASYDYDGAGRKISEINAKGVVTNYYYDKSSNVIKTGVKQDSNGAEVIIKASTYDLLGNVTTIIDGNGNKTYYDYNDFNKVRSVTYQGDGTIEEYSLKNQYDVLGKLKQSIDSLGKVNTQIYDNQGRVIASTEQALDGTSKITVQTSYDKNGNKRFITDGNGNVVENAYDELNRLISTSTTVNKIKKKNTYGYDTNSNKISETDWLGNTTKYIYDDLNRVTEKIDASGKIIERLKYYDNGAQSASVDALNNETKYFYDKNKRLIRTIDAEKHETKQSYDAAGNVVSKIDGNNNETKYFYDQYNNLIKVTNANNEDTTYTYDLNRNKLSQTDGLGNTTIYEYNVANKMIRRIDNGGRVGNEGNYSYHKERIESYTYNANGNIQSKTDRNGLVTKYSYDIHGRKLSENVGSINTSYTYDNNGNQLTITDSTGTTIRTYDELNRAISKVVPNIGESKYEYDITEGLEQGTFGERTTDPKGNVTLRVYDKVGRLSKIIDGEKTTSYSYYDNGSLKNVIYPNGAGEYYSYYGDNSCRNLINKKADGTAIDSYSYTYDGARNILTKVDGKGKTTYSYDSLNRLKTVADPEGMQISYEYDASGNRILETINNAVVTNYKYNDQNRLVSTTTKTNGTINNIVEYTYDNNGNQLTAINNSNEITKNSYNELNELIKTITADGKTITNLYNGEGKRVAKISDGATRRYLYEGEKVILEVDGNGATIGRNVYGTNLISRIAGGVKGYYFYNGHGDVTGIIGEDGAILATYYYDEFGNIKNSTGNFDNQYRYAGYQYDSETGNYYLIARMYDPSIARFLQEDTYRGDPNDPLSLNLYTYCHNNPLVYDDPTGHWPEWLDNGMKKVKNAAGDTAAKFGKFLVDTGNKIKDTTAELGKSLLNIGNQIGEVVTSGAEKAKDAYNYMDDAITNYGKNWDELNKELNIDNQPVRIFEGVFGGFAKFGWGAVKAASFIAGAAVDTVEAAGSAIGNKLGFISDTTYRECITSLKGDFSQISRMPGAIVDSAINTVVNVPRIITDSNMSVEDISNTTNDALNTIFLAEGIGKGLSKSGSVIKNTALSLDDSFSFKTPTSRILDGVNDISNRKPLLNDIQLLANKGAAEPRQVKKLNEWLADDKGLLDEVTEWYNEKPEWWGIDPENTDVFYRTQQEVKEIRKKAGESGGHHPHGLALGGPEGQKLTPTGETAKVKNPTHSQVTGLQRRVINRIKK